MKKILLTSFLFFSVAQLAHAQWTNSGSNVYINSGFVGIGTTNPQNPLDIQRVGSANTGAILSVQGFENSASGGGYLRLIKSRGTTIGSQVTTLSRDIMGTVDYMGVRPNNTLGYSARIIGYQDGPAGTNYLPGKLSFFTGSPDNTLQERMTITSSGNIGLGTTNPTARLTLSGSGNLNPNTGAETDYTGLKILFKGENGSSYDLGSIKMVQPTGTFVDAAEMVFATSFGTLSERMRITSKGDVGIGTPDTKGYKLAVNGGIIATAITVKLNSAWPDYVFKKDYQLPSLQEVKAYIDQHQHLPEIPSEEQIAKEGLNLGEMNKLLMKKVEELTLYLIKKDNKEKEQSAKIQLQESRLKQQQADIDELKSQMQALLKH